jgi:hypothetical protein
LGGNAIIQFFRTYHYRAWSLLASKKLARVLAVCHNRSIPKFGRNQGKRCPYQHIYTVGSPGDTVVWLESKVLYFVVCHIDSVIQAIICTWAAYELEFLSYVVYVPTGRQ